MALAAGWAASLLAFGLLEPFWLKMAVWFVLLVLPLAVVRWRGRAPATEAYPPPPPGGWQAYVWAMVVAYAVAATIGYIAGLHGQPWFWVPAAIVVAVPLSFLALWQSRA